MVYAQLEGADRGIAPIESASTLEVTGIDVDISAKTGEEARLEGWRQAQGKAWKQLWAKSTGGSPAQAPNLSNAELDALVASIVIEQEQIGPTRYIARLGVLFDRAKAAPMLGIGGVIPNVVAINAESARRLNDPSSAPPTSATNPIAVNVIGRMRPHSASLSRSSRALATCDSTVSSVEVTLKSTNVTSGLSGSRA